MADPNLEALKEGDVLRRLGRLERAVKRLEEAAAPKPTVPRTPPKPARA